jgi:hypothetical protein
MKSIRLIAGLLLVLTMLTLAPTVRACPLCADAIANSNAAGDEDDRDNFPAAMNQSIYLMLGVPYLAFGVVGLMIYRGCRKNEEHLQLAGRASDGHEDPSLASS